MSVLIKRIDSSSGGGSKGYPPGNVNIIKLLPDSNKCQIYWSEPDDIVIGSNTLAKWGKTILIRKEGSIPINYKDGTVVLTNTTKNKYKDTGYTDSGLTSNTTYYYRFFTVSSDGVYNNDSNMIYWVYTTYYDQVLANNSWDTISKASESGIAKYIWNIGDEISVDMYYSISKYKYIFQIWDFDHFDKSDGSGKAGIVFGMKNIWHKAPPMYAYVSGFTPNGISWKDTDVRKDIPSYIDENITKYIKEVDTYQLVNTSKTETKLELGKTTDKIFIPAITELLDTNSKYNDTFSIELAKTKKFPIFTNDESYAKKYYIYGSDYSSARNWVSYISRSAFNNYSFYQLSLNLNDSYRVTSVYTTGTRYSYDSYLVFCFNV